MKSGDSIDGMTPHNRKIRHADFLFVAFLDDGHVSELIHVSGIVHGNLLHEMMVDFKNDLQVSGKQFFIKAYGPFFQGFRHEGVIGVGKGLYRDVPGFIPGKMLLVYQKPHELRNGDGRVGVVKLNGDLLRNLAVVRTMLFETS